MSRSLLQSRRAITLSRPLVGSSRKSRLGFVSSSMATAVRLRSPPETPWRKEDESLENGWKSLLKVKGWFAREGGTVQKTDTPS